MPLVHIDISKEPQSKVQARARRAVVEIQVAEAQGTEAQRAVAVKRECCKIIGRCGKMFRGAEPVCSCTGRNREMFLRVWEGLCEAREVLGENAFWAGMHIEERSRNRERFGVDVVKVFVDFSGTKKVGCCLES